MIVSLENPYLNHQENRQGSVKLDEKAPKKGRKGTNKIRHEKVTWADPEIRFKDLKGNTIHTPRDKIVKF